MKKLALALVCLVSVAFFASCTPEGQPSIQVLNEQGFVQDGDVVDLNTDVHFGFKMASSPTSNKALASLVVKIDGVEWASKDLTGLYAYTYEDVVTYEPERGQIIGSSMITAVVTDAAGQIATATINLDINEPAQPLEVKNITWTRKGANLQGDTETEMAANGLQWVARDAFHANIKPAAGCTLYVVEDAATAYQAVTTDVEKAAYFANLMESGRPVDEYRNISVAVTGDKTYNDVLAVIDAQGNKHLVLFEKANVQTGSYGVQTTISGKTK